MGKKTQSNYYITDITKFFNGKKKELSDESKEQTQDDPKNLREEIQGSCPVDDGNVFNQELDDLG